MLDTFRALIVYPGFARFALRSNRMVLVLVSLCVGSAVVLGMELSSAGQSAKRVGVTYQSVTYVGGPGASPDYHPRRDRSRRRSGLLHNGKGDERSESGTDADGVVVTKENWKALQDKADEEREKRGRSGGGDGATQRDEMRTEASFRSGGIRSSVKAHQACFCVCVRACVHVCVCVYLSLSVPQCKAPTPQTSTTNSELYVSRGNRRRSHSTKKGTRRHLRPPR